MIIQQGCSLACCSWICYISTSIWNNSVDMYDCYRWSQSGGVMGQESDISWQGIALNKGQTGAASMATGSEDQNMRSKVAELVRTLRVVLRYLFLDTSWCQEKLHCFLKEPTPEQPSSILALADSMLWWLEHLTSATQTKVPVSV